MPLSERDVNYLEILCSSVLGVTCGDEDFQYLILHGRGLGASIIAHNGALLTLE